MSDKVFLAKDHYIAKAISDINYPVTKKHMIETVGNENIKIDWDKYSKLKDILEPIKIKKFRNAAEFYSSLHSTN